MSHRIRGYRCPQSTREDTHSELTQAAGTRVEAGLGPKVKVTLNCCALTPDSVPVKTRAWFSLHEELPG